MKKSLCAVMLFIGAIAAAQQTDQELYREAETRFLSDDYSLALSLYQDLIDRYPGSRYVPDAQFRVGVALYMNGEFERASAQFDRVGRRFRSTRFLPILPFWTGVLHYELGEYETAVTQLESFLSHEAAASELASRARLYSARSRVALGDLSEATADLTALLAAESPEEQPEAFVLLLSLLARRGESQRLLELTDATDGARLPVEWRDYYLAYRGEALYLEQEYDAAAELFGRVTDATPELSTLAFQRLFLMAEGGFIDAAADQIVRQAERALAGQVDVLQQFWLRVGIQSYQAGNLGESELYFRRIWELREQLLVDPAVPLYLATILEQRSELEAAAVVLQAYLDEYENRESKRTEIVARLGNLLTRLGQADDAVELLRNADQSLRQASSGSDAADSRLAAEVTYQFAFALRAADRTDEALSVVDAAFASGLAAANQEPFLRLKSRILGELGRKSEAVLTLADYLPRAPEDAAAAVEYVNLLFDLNQFERVTDEVPEILGELDRVGTLTALREGQLLYVSGISHINLRQYEEAEARLRRAAGVLSSSDVDAVSLIATSRYYAAWAAYRAGDYERAIATFEEVLELHPDSGRADQAAYYAALSSFQMGDYQSSLELLSRVTGQDGDTRLQSEAEFLSGRALAASGADQQALTVFRRIVDHRAESEYADDALFEYAEALNRLGAPRDAAGAFGELHEDYPESPLAELALWRRGELLYQEEDYGGAQQAFSDYRRAYPRGSQVAAALYWAAEASVEVGQGAQALLLYDQLIQSHVESPFRGDAMLAAAREHERRDEYRAALARYTSLQSAYPALAQSANVDRRIDELVLRLNGIGEREAELLVTIEQQPAESSERADAVVELARLAIFEEFSVETRMSTVVALLNEVAQSASGEAGAESLLLLGQYEQREENYREAATYFLDAAAAPGAPRELRAQAVLYAAEAYSVLGRRAEVDSLVQQLESQFPGSEWTTRARRLLDGRQ